MLLFLLVFLFLHSLPIAIPNADFLVVHFVVVFLSAHHFKPRKTTKATVHSNSHFNKDNLQDTWNARGKLAVDAA